MLTTPTSALRVITFVTILLYLEQMHPFSVTSWVRTPARNKQKGGADNSFHLEWLGADLIPDDKADNGQLVAHARTLGLDAVDEGDHVHVELDYRKPK